MKHAFMSKTPFIRKSKDCQYDKRHINSHDLDRFTLYCALLHTHSPLPSPQVMKLVVSVCHHLSPSDVENTHVTGLILGVNSSVRRIFSALRSQQGLDAEPFALMCEMV